MKIYVNIKKMEKRKNSITQVPYSLPFLPNTVQELIEQVVSHSTEWKSLKEQITLSEGSELTFVRLTMLSGRMW